MIDYGASYVRAKCALCDAERCVRVGSVPEEEMSHCHVAGCLGVMVPEVSPVSRPEVRPIEDLLLSRGALVHREWTKPEWIEVDLSRCASRLSSGGGNSPEGAE